MDPFGFIEFAYPKLPFPYNLFVVILIVGFFILLRFFYKDNKEKIDEWTHSNQKNITLFTKIIILIVFLASVLCFVYDNYIFPEPPEDRFRVAISPFYVEDSDEADIVTAEALKNQIENTSKDRIEVIILDVPPIKDKENAIQKGKKAGSHLVVYGGEKTIVGGTQIEFHILPTNSEIMIPETTYTDKTGSSEFKSAYYKYTDEPVVIVESLKENISSAVYVICAFDYYERFEDDSALKTFKYIKNYENDESILFYVAACYLSKGELNESLIHFNKAIQINPQFSEAWCNKGVVLYGLGNYKEAEDTLDKAIELSPQNFMVWNNKGVILTKLGNYEQAIEAFNNSIKLNSQNYLLWNNKGVTLSNLGKYEQAIEAYDKAIELNPQDPLVWSNKGDGLCKLGKYEQAIEAYEKAIELNPQDSLVWSNKGVVLCELGDYKEAIEACDIAIELNPQDSGAWNTKGIILSKLGNYKEAIEAYDKAIKLNPQDSTAWYNKGNALRKLGNYGESIEAYDKVIELNPQDSIAWYNRARAYYHMKNKEQAIFNLKSAIELNPSCKEIAKNDEVFKELWEDEDFIKLIE